MTTLTPEQRREVESAGAQPVRIADPETHTEYVLLKADLYEKMGSVMEREMEEIDPSFFEIDDFEPAS